MHWYLPRIDRSRWLKVVNFHTNQKPLLVMNCDPSSISPRFRDIARWSRKVMYHFITLWPSCSTAYNYNFVIKVFSQSQKELNYFPVTTAWSSVQIFFQNTLVLLTDYYITAERCIVVVSLKGACNSRPEYISACMTIRCRGSLTKLYYWRYNSNFISVTVRRCEPISSPVRNGTQRTASHVTLYASFVCF